MDSPQPSKEMKSINDLPQTLLGAIFEQLTLADRVRLRSVCKLWNEQLSKVKSKRLSVDPFLYYKERWYHSNRPCRESELCDPNLFVAEFQKSAFSELKYLKLNYRLIESHNKLKDFDLNQLNAFTELLQLDIDYYQTGDLNLHLPNLQIFALRWSKSCKLVLDTPKLNALRYNEPTECDLLSVVHPESVRTLDSAMVGAKLTRFPNLESLRYMHYDPRSIDGATLLNLQQLKAVHYDFRITHFAPGSFEQMKRELQQFMRERRNLGRTDLKVYFVGLQLIADDLSDIDFGLETGRKGSILPIERLYMRHYDRIQDEMRFVWSVNYNRLFGATEVLPDDYFSRFFNLSRVSAACPLNEQHLLEFLRKVYRLEWFKLYDSDLSQAFFDCLPEFRSLTRFVMLQTEARRDRRGDEIHLDFTFIGKLEEMRILTLHEDLSVLSLRSFIPSLKHLKRINQKCQFRFKGIYFEMKSKATEGSSDQDENADKYVLQTDNDKIILKSTTLCEMVKYFENLALLAGPD